MMTQYSIVMKTHLCYELTDISDGKQSVNSTRTTAAWNKTEGF